MASPVEDKGATKIASVTPSDTVNLPGGPCRALWVGGAGNVVLLAEEDSSAVTITAVQAGTLLPIRARRVNSTSTTATNIVALY